jgi:predicted enzyme related to lactoylglutathione lyase
MNLEATRIITDDVDGLLAFYARLTGVAANRIHPLFGEIAMPGGVLAIASSATIPLLGEGSLTPRANRSITLDFRVDDVDASYAELRDELPEIVKEPTDMPWGNRSLLFRDPDGNLVNLFTPVSPDARARFGLGDA